MTDFVLELSNVLILISTDVSETGLSEIGRAHV
jgi:hypothetical protein